MLYQQDEKVLCFHGPLIYQAKILNAEDWQGKENRDGASGPHYLVHYQGWKKTWDEWVPQERLLKFNDENIAKQKALVDARKAEAAAATAAKNAAADASAARARADTRKAQASSSAARGTKRGREPDADEGERRPEIKLNVPDALKVQLVDDWENVTRKEQLVPLPRKPNVKEILNEYAEYYTSSPAHKNAARPRSPAVLHEVLAGLKLYFDKSLAHNLLYRFERPQYVELRKRVGPKMGDGDVEAEVAAALAKAGRSSEKSARRSSAADDAEASSGLELEASEIYGAEHLLRLFVNLPGIIAHTSMDAESVALLREHLTEFLQFLAKEQSRLFVREYEDPSPTYQRYSAM